MLDRQQSRTFVKGASLSTEDDHLESFSKAPTPKSRQMVTHTPMPQLRHQPPKKKALPRSERQATLIAIRDTPVEPVPQPIQDNQKCERATQEQFEYFQSFISQREKERKFQDEQQLKIHKFEEMQKAFQAAHQGQQLSIVMQKEDMPKVKIVKKPISLKIKKKEEVQCSRVKSLADNKGLAGIKLVKTEAQQENNRLGQEENFGHRVERGSDSEGEEDTHKAGRKLKKVDEQT